MLNKSKYKDLNKWRRTNRNQKRRYYGKTKKSENCRQPWTQKEIDMVMEHKITDTELANLIGRSVGSIQVMRARQRKAEMDSKE